MAEKSQVSHRGKALYEIRDEFDKVMKWIDQHMPDPEIVGCQGELRAFQARHELFSLSLKD